MDPVSHFCSPFHHYSSLESHSSYFLINYCKPNRVSMKKQQEIVTFAYNFYDIGWKEHHSNNPCFSNQIEQFSHFSSSFELLLISYFFFTACNFLSRFWIGAEKERRESQNVQISKFFLLLKETRELVWFFVVTSFKIIPIGWSQYFIFFSGKPDWLYFCRCWSRCPAGCQVWVTDPFGRGMHAS